MSSLIKFFQLVLLVGEAAIIFEISPQTKSSKTLGVIDKNVHILFL